MTAGAGLGSVAGGALGTIFPGVGTALGASLGGAIGGLFGGGAPGKRRKNENYTKLRNLYREGGAIQQQIGQGYAQSAGQLEQGYGQALGAIGEIGESERTQILQGQQQQIAEMNQSMTNRGLYNTSLGAGAGQGFQNIRQNTQLALGNLSAQLAGLRANLYTQRGTALSQNTLGQVGAQYQRQGAYGNVLSGPLAAPSAEGGWQAGPGPGLSEEQFENLTGMGQQIGSSGFGKAIGNLFGGSKKSGGGGGGSGPSRR